MTPGENILCVTHFLYYSKSTCKYTGHVHPNTCVKPCSYSRYGNTLHMLNIHCTDNVTWITWPRYCSPDAYSGPSFLLKQVNKQTKEANNNMDGEQWKQPLCISEVRKWRNVNVEGTPTGNTSSSFTNNSLCCLPSPQSLNKGTTQASQNV